MDSLEQLFRGNAEHLWDSPGRGWGCNFWGDCYFRNSRVCRVMKAHNRPKSCKFKLTRGLWVNIITQSSIISWMTTLRWLSKNGQLKDHKLQLLSTGSVTMKLVTIFFALLSLICNSGECPSRFSTCQNWIIVFTIV